LKKNGILIFPFILIFIQSLFSKGAALTNVDYVVYTVPPISNEKILPKDNKDKINVMDEDEISIFACPGEYEPASLVIFANKSLEDINVNISGLRQEIEVDVRVVKCWYQAGRAINDVKHKTLTPELLLHDDGIVEVDPIAKKNIVRKGNLQDAPKLLPFSIPKGEYKQIWITFFIPEEFQPGDYQGKIAVRPQNALPKEIHLKLKVLPIMLSSTLLDYSIYYRGKLRLGDFPPEIGSEWKTEGQLEAELKDMKVHGIDNPTVYQPMVQRADGGFDFSILGKVLEIRKSVGIGEKPLLYLGLQTGAPHRPEELERLKQKVKALVAFAKTKDIHQVYIYGIDEARGKRLRTERLAFKGVHEAGGKVFVACGSDFADLVGDLLDLPIYSGIPPSSNIEKVHKFGHKIWNYGNPQCGVEEPLTYRRNYGLLLWQKGLDGTCDYAYQHAFGDIWDDFDHPTYRDYRDHVMAYPTIDGVIPTIQWEGFREGIDDVRYLSTLIKEIEKAEAKGNFGGELNEAKGLLEKIKTMELNRLSDEDFQKIRWRISQQIILLQ